MTTKATNMSADLHQWKGWRMGLCEFHAEILAVMPERVSEVLTRAFYRAYNLPDFDALKNVAFAYDTDMGMTCVLNLPKGSDEERLVDGVLMGVWSALELEYERLTEDKEVTA